MTIPPRRYFSRWGEDLVIAQHFPADFKGIYLDIGAWDPAAFSNTMSFYEAGWQGVCVDPNPDLAVRYAETRPRDRFLNVGLGPVAGTLPYYHFAAHTSCNTFDATARDRWMQSSGDSVEEKKIPVITWADLLGTSALDYVDYVNIDAEFMDEILIKTFPFDRLWPRIIAVEDHAMDLHNAVLSPILQHLEQKGYVLVSQCGYTSIYLFPLQDHEKAMREKSLKNRAFLRSQLVK